MRYLRVIASDFAGIRRVLGFPLALKWLVMIGLNARAILRQRNLSPADESMGRGPFSVRYSPTIRFNVAGPAAFAGTREMYVRDTYLRGGILEIKDGDVVLDLGSNIGNFANLALAHGPCVRVYAVEPSTELNDAWRSSLGLNNNFLDRARLVSAFLGIRGDKQAEVQEKPDYSRAPWLSEEQLLASWDLTRIDFLKCDIEGGEFGLLTSESKLLRMARNVAIEIHHFAGDVGGFLSMLVDHGFAVVDLQGTPGGTVTALASRCAPADRAR